MNWTSIIAVFERHCSSIRSDVQKFFAIVALIRSFYLNIRQWSLCWLLKILQHPLAAYSRSLKFLWSTCGSGMLSLSMANTVHLTEAPWRQTWHSCSYGELAPERQGHIDPTNNSAWQLLAIVPSVGTPWWSGGEWRRHWRLLPVFYPTFVDYFRRYLKDFWGLSTSLRTVLWRICLDSRNTDHSQWTTTHRWRHTINIHFDKPSSSPTVRYLDMHVLAQFGLRQHVDELTYMQRQQLWSCHRHRWSTNWCTESPSTYCLCSFIHPVHPSATASSTSSHHSKTTRIKELRQTNLLCCSS